jgi:hypothetical protein
VRHFGVKLPHRSNTSNNFIFSRSKKIISDEGGGGGDDLSINLDGDFTEIIG